MESPHCLEKVCDDKNDVLPLLSRHTGDDLPGLFKNSIPISP